MTLKEPLTNMTMKGSQTDLTMGRRDWEGHTIDTADDEQIAILITERAVAREVIASVGLHVSLEIPLVITIDASGDRGPGASNGEDTADIVLGQDGAASLVKEHRLDTKER